MKAMTNLSNEFNFLEDVRNQSRYYRRLAEQAMDQLEAEQLFSAANADSNSIAVIAGHLSGNMLSAPLGLVVTRQVRLQGITVGNRDGFEAMMRAIEQHKLQPVTDKVFAFEELKEAMAYLKSGAHFGKVCIRH